MIRIDDRLIHGQVVVGWCPNLKPDRLILCDDEIARSDWESQIYKDASNEYAVSVCTVDETVDLIQDGKFENDRIFLIVGYPGILVRLLQQGLMFNKVTVGGMHYESGKRKVLDFVYIDDTDLKNFQYLHEQNILIECKALPNCKSVNLAVRLGLV